MRKSFGTIASGLEPLAKRSRAVRSAGRMLEFRAHGFDRQVIADVMGEPEDLFEVTGQLGIGAEPSLTAADFAVKLAEIAGHHLRG